jgi:hypothetical protein
MIAAGHEQPRGFAAGEEGMPPKAAPAADRVRGREGPIVAASPVARTPKSRVAFSESSLRDMPKSRLLRMGSTGAVGGRTIRKSTEVSLSGAICIRSARPSPIKMGGSAAALLYLGAFNNARADETVKFRIIMHVTAAQTLDVSGADGQTMTVLHYSGLASFADGSVGTANLTATTDYNKGSGTYTGYYNIVLKDGSTITYKATNVPARSEGTVTNFPEAPVSIVHGTGRFDGAKGDGITGGQRLTPLAVGAETYQDATLNIKK